MRALRISGAVLGAVLLCLVDPPTATAVLIREVRATKARIRGFGYVKIRKKRWCIVSAEAEMMEATSGRPMGETYFGSRDKDVCRVLWRATWRKLRVDVSALPERSVVDPLFLGSVKKIYVVGYVWVRVR